MKTSIFEAFFRTLLTILIALALGGGVDGCHSGGVKARRTEDAVGKPLPNSENIGDHAKTGFPLTGPHQGLDCGFCHKVPGRRREYSCHECHKGHDGDHDGRCLDCHRGGFPGGH